MRTRPKDGGGKAKTGALSVLLQTTQDGPASTPDFQVPRAPGALISTAPRPSSHKCHRRELLTTPNYKSGTHFLFIKQHSQSCCRQKGCGQCRPPSHQLTEVTRGEATTPLQPFHQGPGPVASTQAAPPTGAGVLHHLLQPRTDRQGQIQWPRGYASLVNRRRTDLQT